MTASFSQWLMLDLIKRDNEPKEINTSRWLATLMSAERFCLHLMEYGWDFTTSHQKDTGTFTTWLMSVFTSPVTFIVGEENKLKRPGCTHSLCWARGNARWASRCFWLLSCRETLGQSLTVCAHGAWSAWSESWRLNLDHRKTIGQKTQKQEQEWWWMCRLHSTSHPWEEVSAAINTPDSLSLTAMALFLGRPRGRRVIVGTSSSEWSNVSKGSSTYSVKKNVWISNYTKTST